MNKLPEELIDYIWSFDGIKEKNYLNCMNELNENIQRYNTLVSISITNRLSYWFSAEYKNNEHKFLLFKLRERRSFNARLT
tara:strand:+ start:541 stop:783 length:243 start_codon:yes stop_codon:yes gene_type:complete